MPPTLAHTRAKTPASYTRAELMRMPADELLELYHDAVGMLKSYIGGDGGLELGLWATVLVNTPDVHASHRTRAS